MLKCLPYLLVAATLLGAEPKSSLDQVCLSSCVLQNQRQVGVYTPAGYDFSHVYPLLVVFDGESYRERICTPKILDTLISEGKSPPVVAVFVGNVDRNVELPCCEPFAKFVVKELLPCIEQRYSISTDRDERVIAGSSYGGLAASFTALRYPEVFGKVLSQSGSFGWGAGQSGAGGVGFLIRDQQGRSKASLPVMFYLEVGSQETCRYRGYPSITEANQEFQTILETNGHRVTYHTFEGGHDYPSWGKALPRGLEWAFSS